MVQKEKNSEVQEAPQETIKEKFDKYCEENPEALECRIYDN